VVSLSTEKIAQIHQTSGHCDYKYTMYFVRNVSRKEVQRIVHIRLVKSASLSTLKWTSSDLSVDNTWCRIGMDITHHEGRHYLSLIDCGPSRFAVWKRLRRQDSAAVIEQLEVVFLERGAPPELLTDNDIASEAKRSGNSQNDGAFGFISDVLMLHLEMVSWKYIIVR